MLSEVKVNELKKYSKEIRVQILEQLVARGFGHLGGSMSIVEILAVLYGEEMKYDPKNPKWEGRDWLVCSKGHAGPAVYASLALKGFFPVEELKTLNQRNTNLPSHCDQNKTPGIDITTGSLGQGLSVAQGVALGHKLKDMDNYTYCIVGDGELQEGQNWESIMSIAQLKLDNLILFVDSNKVQLDGPVHLINNLESYDAKFNAFNWNTLRVDGHDLSKVQEAIQAAKAHKGQPSVIICDTVKGKGIVWAENEFNHHIEVSREMADKAIEAMNA